jgi:Cd2+/Zn2+-exporting ATPase
MKLPINDKKFLFLLFAIAIIVVALEVLSIIGIHIPMPYAPFIFAAFILGIGYNVIWNGLKAFSN